MKNSYSVFHTRLTIFAERHNICGNIFCKSVLGGRLMLASLSTPEWGKRLRAERERLRLSLRDVETLSRTIAKDRQDPNYYIAHASLADIENGKLTPTIYKLYSLSVIYGLDYDRLAILAGVPVPEAEKDQKTMALPRTYLIGPKPQRRESEKLPAVELREKLRAERTNLVQKMLEAWEEIPALLQEMRGNNPLYGYIGMDDYTLHPFIRPGSFVRIDPRQKKIPPVNWHTDHDRPVFFLELRERYVCSWCEIHESQLILSPSQQSQRRAQQLRYPGDATIIGRVTAVAMSIVEAQST
jgi:transcriptional regulator with XRE-family HTH domain